MALRLLVLAIAIALVVVVQEVMYMIEALWPTPSSLFMAIPAIIVTFGGYVGAIGVRKYRGRDKMKVDVLLSIIQTALLLNPLAWLIKSAVSRDILSLILSLVLVLMGAFIARRIHRSMGPR